MGNDASSPFNAEGEVTKVTRTTNDGILLFVLFFVRPVFVLFLISPNKDGFIVCVQLAEDGRKRSTLPPLETEPSFYRSPRKGALSTSFAEDVSIN